MNNISTIRVMADYSSTGLWNEKGYQIYPEDLVLPEKIVLELNTYIKMYDENKYFLNFVYVDIDDEEYNNAIKLTQLGWKIATDIFCYVNETNQNITVKFYNEFFNKDIIVNDKNKYVEDVFNLNSSIFNFE